MKFYFLFYSYLFLDLRGEENCNVFLLNSSLIMGFMQWRTRGGNSWGGSFNITSSSGNLQSTSHCLNSPKLKD